MAKKPEAPAAANSETPVDPTQKRYRAKFDLVVGRDRFPKGSELIGVATGTIDSLVNCGHAEEFTPVNE